VADPSRSTAATPGPPPFAGQFLVFACICRYWRVYWHFLVWAVAGVCYNLRISGSDTVAGNVRAEADCLKAVRALKLGEIVWDGTVPGFAARRQTCETVADVVKFRTTVGRQRWHTIGRHGAPWAPDTAREEAAGSSARWHEAPTRAPPNRTGGGR
jgi:hypothetical protein